MQPEPLWRTSRDDTVSVPATIGLNGIPIRMSRSIPGDTININPMT